MPPLPPKILEEVRTFNAGVFEQFQALAWTIASTRKISQDDLSMPFTEKLFPDKWDSRGDPKTGPFDSAGSKFQELYLGQIVRSRSRSPFSGVCGANDEFKSPLDLVKYTRAVMHFDPNSLPMAAPALPAAIGHLEATNSWIVDFLIHGKIKYLWEDNGINYTKAYKYITAFRDAVKQLVAVIKVYCPNQDDIVLKAFTNLGLELDKYLKSV